MRTNAEKYAHYIEEIRKKLQPFIDATLGEPRPDKFYRIKRQYEYEECTVTGTYYALPFPYHGGKPTRQHIATVKAYLDDMPEPSEDNILLNYKAPCGSSFLNGAERLTKIKAEPYLAFTIEELRPELDRRRERYELKEGDIACAYCHKAFPEKDVVERTIINFKMYGRQGKRNKYCSSECGLHDQFAHEG